MTASGSGFTPGEPITVQRDGVVIVTVPAGADGSFSTRVDIAGVQNGDHEITATGTLSGFSATGVFDVEPQICTSDSTVTTPASFAVVLYSVAGTTGGTTVVGLASTGFPVGSALSGAALALMVGTMLLVTARNRRGARAGAGGPSDNGPRHL